MQNLRENQTGSGTLQSSPLAQVPEQFARLGTTSEDNEKLLSEIEERLRPVLRAAPVSNGSDQKSAPEEYMVPLAENVRTIHKSAIRLNNALRAILANLEL